MIKNSHEQKPHHCNLPHAEGFLSNSTFEIDLRTGKVFTYQTPPENIGVSCQQEEFDLDLLRNRFQDDLVIEHGMEEFKRIPSIRKIAPAEDIMCNRELLLRSISRLFG